MSWELKQVGAWKKFYLSDLQTVTLDFIQTLEPGCMIILEGDLGAGKTTFTQSFVKNYLSSNSEVTSPTYSLINEIGPIVHADLYRVEDPEELVHLEIEMYLEDKEYFFVEWGEKYLSFLAAHIPSEWSIFIARLNQNPLPEGKEAASRNLILEQVFL